MFCCFAIPFCFGGAILMVFLTSTFAQKMSEHIGEWVLILTPLSAIVGLFLGWQMMMLFFRLI
jgi:hypothetical protein